MSTTIEKNYTFYTDGSCLNNPGYGGWAFCMVDEYENKPIKISSGGEPETTNNRMELLAVINALSECSSFSVVNIHIDSQWVIYCAKGNWKRRANLDLWKKYEKVSKDKVINFHWVRGHSGNQYNEIVDTMARDQAILIRKLHS